MAKVVKLTVSLDSEIEKAVRNLAKKEDRNISLMVQHCIKFYIANKKD